MSQTELSYEELRENVTEELQKHIHGVLATSEGNFVTAREMGLIYDGLTIFSFTAKDSRKYKQIAVNSNVAITARNIQIEGTATLKGHPLDEENTNSINVFQKTQPEVYEVSNKLHFHRQDMRLIEIIPRKISKYTNDIESKTGAYLDILNIPEKKAHRVKSTELLESPAYNE